MLTKSTKFPIQTKQNIAHPILNLIEVWDNIVKKYVIGKQNSNSEDKDEDTDSEDEDEDSDSEYEDKDSGSEDEDSDSEGEDREGEDNEYNKNDQ